MHTKSKKSSLPRPSCYGWKYCKLLDDVDLKYGDTLVFVRARAFREHGNDASLFNVLVV